MSDHLIFIGGGGGGGEGGGKITLVLDFFSSRARAWFFYFLQGTSLDFFFSQDHTFENKQISLLYKR